MKIIYALIICALMSGCAYSAYTTLDTKGKNINALVGGIPIRGDADVTITRKCKWTIFAKPIKDNK